jgi:prolipoprotein diacylglyceryltransferase
MKLFLFLVFLKYYGLCLPLIAFMHVHSKGIFKAEKLSNQAHEALFMYGNIGIFVGARLGHCFFMILITIRNT